MGPDSGPFDEFHRDLGIARNVLADQLDRMVTAGILETRPYQQCPVRHEYVLTYKGSDLLGVLLALWRWGDRWGPGQYGAAPGDDRGSIRAGSADTRSNIERASGDRRLARAKTASDTVGGTVQLGAARTSVTKNGLPPVMR